MTDEISGEQSRIEAKLRSALKRLDLTSQFIIQSIYGVLGCSGQSSKKVAQREEVSEETIEGIQADALRALMGYGPKSPAAVEAEEELKPKKAKGEKAVPVTGDLLN